jgi:hypothetical protein
MRVAVPPILEVIIWEIKKGIGFTCKILVRENVTGTMISTW